jgi:hypothetical protein
MAFDYDTPDVSAATLDSVVAEMSGSGLEPLTDEQLAERNFQHELWLMESRARDEQQRLEYEQKRLAAAEAERVELERQNAIGRAKERERIDAELRERLSRRTDDQRLSEIHGASIRAEQYRHGFARSAQMAASRHRLSAALDNVVATRYPPPPPAPTTVVVSESDGSEDFGSPNFDPAKWMKKPRSWW